MPAYIAVTQTEMVPDFARLDLLSPLIAPSTLSRLIAGLIDRGVLKTTLIENFETIDAKGMRRAHVLIESGKATGEIALEGF